MGSESKVSQILDAMRQGDPEAAAKLLPLVYNELHHLAAAQMAREKPGHTLQTTALVHEAYLRLFGDGEACWENRRHFFAAAAEAMRRILVEYARRKACIKRGGNLHRVDLEGHDLASSSGVEDLLDLDEAITALAVEAPEKAELVKLRCFAGLSLHEATGCMGISRSTAERYWAYARAWLYDRLGSAPSGTAG